MRMMSVHFASVYKDILERLEVVTFDEEINEKKIKHDLKCFLEFVQEVSQESEISKEVEKRKKYE